MEKSVVLSDQLPKFNPELVPEFQAMMFARKILRKIVREKKDPKMREEYERFRIEYEAEKGGTK